MKANFYPDDFLIINNERDNKSVQKNKKRMSVKEIRPLIISAKNCLLEENKLVENKNENELLNKKQMIGKKDVQSFSEKRILYMVLAFFVAFLIKKLLKF